MYTEKGTAYSEAGKLLKIERNGTLTIAYQTPVSLETKITEEDITLDDMKIDDDFITYSSGNVVQLAHPERSYAEWKSAIIKWRYSNDDQIAIILNRDDSEGDRLKYERMQAWRDWASTLAKKIVSLQNK